MNKTRELIALSNSSQPQNILVIHPNDGADLGFLAISSKVKIFFQISLNDRKMSTFQMKPTYGILNLENNCKAGTVQLNSGFWKKIGKPVKIQLIFNNEKLFIINK